MKARYLFASYTHFFSGYFNTYAQVLMSLCVLFKWKFAINMCCAHYLYVTAPILSVSLLFIYKKLAYRLMHSELDPHSYEGIRYV